MKLHNKVGALLKLTIKNLAHIESATLNDESDLTVIVGDNGTGKTLLLETYTLLSEEITQIRSAVGANLMSNFLNDFTVKFNEETLELLKDIFTFHKNILTETYDFEVPRRHFLNNVQEKLIGAFPELKTGLNLEVKIEISNTDAINSFLDRNTKEMKKKFTSLTESKILFNTSTIEDIDFISEVPTLESNNIFNFDLVVSPSFWRIDRLPFLKLLPSVDEFDQFSWPKTLNSINLRVLSVFMHSKLNNNYINTLHSDVLLMPTERNSIIANSNLRTRKELESNKIFSRYSEFSFTMEFLKFKEEIGGHSYNFFEDSNQLNEFETSTNLNKDDNDLYEQVKDIKFYTPTDNAATKHSSENRDELNIFPKKHSDELSKMLGGQLLYDKGGELNSIVDFDGNIISKKLFSTKQNHMSSFAILEENISQYDVFIIEEPEANLSLKAIKQLVDYLVHLITDYKIRLILTTHNELFFQRLNLKLFQNPQITSSVYEFETKGQKSRLKKIDKGEFGYSIKLFNDELENIFNETNNSQNY